MSLEQPHGLQVYHRQTDIDVTKNPPVLNTWYTIIDEPVGAIIDEFFVIQVNTEANAKDVEIRITKDAIVDIDTQTLPNNTLEYLFLDVEGLTVISTTVTRFGALWDLGGGVNGLMPFEYGRVKVEIRLVTAAGTAQTLRYFMRWRKLELV